MKLQEWEKRHDEHITRFCRLLAKEEEPVTSWSKVVSMLNRSGVMDPLWQTIDRRPTVTTASVMDSIESLLALDLIERDVESQGIRITNKGNERAWRDG